VSETPGAAPDRAKAARQMAIRGTLFPLVMVGVLFGCAGRLDLPLLWAYVGVYVVAMIVVWAATSPSLRAERIHPGPGERDKLTLRVTIPLIFVQWILAGLDGGRWQFSEPILPAARIAGLVLLAVALGLSAWAIHVNEFFSSAVRLQPERGQRIIRTGPYRFLRHPGYAGGFIGLVGGTLALGTWWGFLPAAISAVSMVRRTLIEDRMLQAELHGYADYARDVPYRVAPGIW